MNLRTAPFVVLVLLASGDAAHAHGFVEAGFLNGFLHPLLVPAHALALLAFGLMAGQHKRRQRWFLTMLFAAALAAGLLMIMSATVPLNIVPAILLACAAAAGLLVALAQPLPRVVPAAILAAGALTLMFDSVPSVVSKIHSILSLAGTMLAATLTLGLVAYAAACPTREWQRIGVRVIGSWAAASALLVLALMLVK